MRYFWYSKWQKLAYEHLGILSKHFAIINGKEVEYSEVCDHKQETTGWKDEVYLGIGETSRHEFTSKFIPSSLTKNSTRNEILAECDKLLDKIAFVSAGTK